MYHIIIRSLTCPILGIPVPSYDLLREARWPPSSHNRRYRVLRETAVAMDLIDQLSTYIYRYVDNDQNKIHL